MCDDAHRRQLGQPSFLAASSLALITLLVAPGALAQVTVEIDQVRQKIDGFGASSAFFSEDISQADADWLFSPEDGIGLSLLRVRINHENNDTTDIETAKKAYAHGAQVWAAPWTPPPEFKTNGELYVIPEEGSSATPGRLRTDSYGAFAEYLADFAEWMEAEGVPLIAITPQNEPDWNAWWDGCAYTPQELATFIGDYLGPEFEARGLEEKVMIVAPDTAHLANLDSYAQALVTNTNVMKYLDGISTHPYAGTDFDNDWSVPEDYGLLFWQTEVSQENFNPRDYPDPSMDSALTMYEMMHEHLTELEMSAWNWWNLTATAENYQDDVNRQNPAFIQDGEKFRRGYVMGNFSKFVRPGFHRVMATAQPANGVLVSAYVGDLDGGDQRLVVVAGNLGGSATTQTITLSGDLEMATLSEVVPWVTSDSAALTAQTALTVTDGAFMAGLPARSVTSFVVDIDRPLGGSGGSGGGGGSGAGGSTSGSGGVASGGSGAGATAGTGNGGGGAGVGGTGAGASAGVGGGGAPSTGGAATVGGSSSVGGTGAASGTGGGLLTGGTVGAGATGAGGDGLGTAAAAGTTGGSPSAPNGCSCRAANTGAQGASARWALVALAGAAMWARRRARWVRA